jgi:N-acetylglucosaminyl-diphospho-decaprenol L-rhamnosyltransferase
VKTCAVIVNYRTSELTSAAITSILADDPLTEVVVVDNDSGDGSSARLRRAWSTDRARILDAGANIGFGAGVNLGSRGATADALLILNSDARVLQGAIANLRAALHDDERLAIAAPLVLAPGGVPQVDAYGSFPSLKSMALRTNRRPREDDAPDWVSGVGFLIRRSAFEAVGGFDEAYWMYFEDIDLCRRLRASGWGLRRIRGAAIEHLGGASRVTTRTQGAQYARSQRRYLQSAGYPSILVDAIGALRRPVDQVRSARRRR